LVFTKVILRCTVRETSKRTAMSVMCNSMLQM
jgi:hypothetical protein